MYRYWLVLVSIIVCTSSLCAQKDSLPVNQEDIIKNFTNFEQFSGWRIHNIYIIRLAFNQNINNIATKEKMFFLGLANALHKQSREHIIRKNLFFKEGETINQYLMMESDRFLRTIDFLQDARIVLKPDSTFSQTVNVYVLTKDVFSLGANINASGTDNFDIEIKDENVAGTGNRASIQTLYDNARLPRVGYGAAYTERNIGGRFVNFTGGFKSFNGAFSTGLPEETYVYAGFDKPLVSAYMPFTGSAQFSIHRTNNFYVRQDSIYNTDFNYQYIDFDCWGGFNLGSKSLLLNNKKGRLRKFVALRATHQKFQEVPGFLANTYDYRFANLTAILGSFTIFNQIFYKTKYIYGFGRQEDVPEGYNVNFIGGWTDKQNLQRPYYGIDVERNYFDKKNNYYDFTVKIGGFLNETQFEDLSLLINLDYFSKLKRINSRWYTRNFNTIGITQQIRPRLNQPLFLTSPFGIPELANGNIAAQTRVTGKTEKVWYGTWKLLKFSFAPFVFANASLLTPQSQTLLKTDLFTSLGLGLRSRNENLVFGTMEVRISYFPRVNSDMQQLKIDVASGLRFRYNSQYVKKPDFVNAN